jgi:hypothetical protein
MPNEAAGGSPPLNHSARSWRSSLFRKRLAISIAVFLLAFSVRVFTWHDTRLEVGKVQTLVTADYWRIAELFEREGVPGFFSSSSPLADLNNLGHPPGYSILIALIHSLFGGSQSAVQFAQILFDAAGAVIILLLVAEFFSATAATLAGLFAALAPQFAWNSVLLLPDSLAVFPILLAVYLLARARRSPRFITFAVAGALIGLSCWLRANAMLLTAFFAIATLLLLGQKSWRYSLAIVCGTLVIILPLTIRNAVVFHRFIPVSLGAGQTFLEGIADYDPNGRLGVPNTDLGIMRQEAELYQRPDYYGLLFKPDGVERERARLRRGLSVIGSHPAWFASVMTRRAGSMLRLERVRLMSLSPAVSHSLDLTNVQPRLINSAELLNHCLKSDRVTVVADAASSSASFTGNNLRDGPQLSSCSLPVSADTDYVFASSIRMEQGRVRLSLRAPNVSQIVEPIEGKRPTEQPAQSIQLPFVASGNTVNLEIRNEASSAPPLAHIDEIKLYELGPARFLWTRYPRIILRGIQHLFITAVFLPLALIGLGVTIFRKQMTALVILSVVPLYYFCVQSAFHTEYRYVLAVNYFLFAFAAVAVCWLVSLITKRIAFLRTPSRSTR